MLFSFPGFWNSALSALEADDLAAVAPVSRQLNLVVAEEIRQMLVSYFSPHPVVRPAGISWTLALHRAYSSPTMLIVGGEDTQDMPQLHLSLVSSACSSRSSSCSSRCTCNLASHSRLDDSNGVGCRLSAGRYRVGACRLGPRIFMLGGTGPEGDPRWEVLVFNIVSRNWESDFEQPQMPLPRVGHEVVGILGRYLLCIGGKCTALCKCEESGDAIAGPSIDVLDTWEGRWVRLPCKLAHPRAYFGATVCHSSRLGRTFVVVTGGSVVGGSMTRAFLRTDGRVSSTELLDVTDLPAIVAALPTLPPLSATGLARGQESGDEMAAAQLGTGASRPSGVAVAGHGDGSVLVSDSDAAAEAPASRADSFRDWPQWFFGPNLISARSDFSLAGPLHGRLFAVGGSGARQSVEVLEVNGLEGYIRDSHATDEKASNHATWEVHPVPLPQARSGALAVALGNRILYAGGSKRPVYYLDVGPEGTERSSCDFDESAAGPGLLSSGWQLLEGGDLDTLRLGARAVAFGEA